MGKYDLLIMAMLAIGGVWAVTVIMDKLDNHNKKPKR